MTSLALGIAGAVVGSFFGSPQIGFLIGSLIGSLLDPPKTKGPRLQDLKLQSSTYGKVIPFVWGTGRMAGNVIDQTDLEEHSHTSSGKGGPEVEEFTYTCSLCIQLCAAPVFGQPALIGINRIWADGRLWWDVNTSDEGLPCTFYDGRETQLPDPTFEAIHGVGQVPAYRGTAYVVFTDLDVGEFGNRPPSFEFEVFTGAGTYPWQVSVGHPWRELNYNAGAFEYVNGEIIATLHHQAPYIHKWEKYDLDLNSLQGPVYTSGGDAAVATAINHNNWVGLTPSTTNFYWEIFDDATGNSNQSLDISLDWANFPAAGNPAIATGSDKEFWFGINQANAPAVLMKYYNGVGGFIDSVAIGGGSVGSECWMGTSDGSQELYVSYWDGLAYPVGGTQLWKFDIDLNVLDYWDTAALSATRLNGQGTRGNFVVYKGQLAFNYHAGSGPLDNYIALVDLGPGIAADSAQPLLQQPNGEGRLAYLGNGLVLNVTDGVFSLNPPPAAVLLSTIVGDLSDMTPAAGAYDVSELTDEVDWFAVGSQMTVRNAIQALRQVFFFDGVESDDLIKFRKRSEVPTFEFPDGSLCGRAYGEPSGDPLKTIRQREQEIPRQVSVTHIQIDNDYQTGVQLAQRNNTLSQQDVSVEVPVGLSASEAKSKAETLLTAAWLERETFEWSSTRSAPVYDLETSDDLTDTFPASQLEPCDVGIVRGRVIRIMTKSEQPNGVIKYTGVLAAPSRYTTVESSIYTQPADRGVDSPGFTPPVAPGAKVDTTMLLLDVPLLRETDYPNGPYAAIKRAAAGPWTGAGIYKSIDGGASYSSIATTATENVMGTVAVALGDFGGGNIFDESNSLTVIISTIGGTLSSASRLAVKNGANAALVGSAANGYEVIQFRTATLTATNTYKLTGLLRGRRGTGWAVGWHGVNETFVLIPPLNINGVTADFGATRKYKAVSNGKAIADATAQDFTQTPITTKPFSPSHFGGGRDASGNITLHWKRRTRVGGAWLNYADVPLSEASEYYRLFFYSDGTFSTLVSQRYVPAATSYVYTAADQTAEFGSPQGTLYAQVVQGGSYGDGYATSSII